MQEQGFQILLGQTDSRNVTHQRHLPERNDGRLGNSPVNGGVDGVPRVSTGWRRLDQSLEVFYMGTPPDISRAGKRYDKSNPSNVFTPRI